MGKARAGVIYCMQRKYEKCVCVAHCGDPSQREDVFARVQNEIERRWAMHGDLITVKRVLFAQDMV